MEQVQKGILVISNQLVRILLQKTATCSSKTFPTRRSPNDVTVVNTRVRDISSPSPV